MDATSAPVVRNTALLTAMHAAVDALCACCVLMLSPQMDARWFVTFFVTYNCIAFLTQPLVGWWLDVRGLDLRQLPVAVALLAVGGLTGVVAMTAQTVGVRFLAVVLVAMGNSLFHVYAGKSVTEGSGNDLRHLGVLVSSGALGLLIGGIYPSPGVLMALIVALCVLAYFQQRQAVMAAVMMSTRFGWSGSRSWLFAFVLLVVLIRSFIGKLTTPPDNDIPFYATTLVILAVAGKASGGYLARRIGVWPMLTSALLLAGVCFLLGDLHSSALLAMVLLINLTMPLTLHIANGLASRRAGFAFGMLAAMLVPGYGLGILVEQSLMGYDLLMPLVATMVVEALVLLALRERRWQVLAMSVVMNVITNLPLNLYVVMALDCRPTVAAVVGLEGMVLVIEALLYRLVTHDWRKAIVYAVLCNLTSYAMGLAFQNLFF